ncbi:MAG: cupin domain-containing protein [Thaumarchaeota archaeon]|nr:cupin domain-containing protein [Nitrososphaerota archaeon]
MWNFMQVIQAGDSLDGFAKSFYSGRSMISITKRTANAKDGEHVHLMTQESTFVLAGEIEVLAIGKWERVGASSGVVFDIREPHDVRTRADAPVVSWPGIAEGIVAVTATERVVPPSLDIFEDEVDMVVREDQFDSQVLSDPVNRSYWSKGLQLDPGKSQRFWDILARNQKKVESLHKVLNI